LHLLLSGREVLTVREGRLHDRGIGGAGRRRGLEPWYPLDRRLDGRRDIILDDLGGCAGVGSHDDQRRQLERGDELLLQVVQRQPAEDGSDDRDEGDQRTVAQTQNGEVRHGGSLSGQGLLRSSPRMPARACSMMGRGSEASLICECQSTPSMKTAAAVARSLPWTGSSTEMRSSDSVRAISRSLGSCTAAVTTARSARTFGAFRSCSDRNADRMPALAPSVLTRSRNCWICCSTCSISSWSAASRNSSRVSKYCVVAPRGTSARAAIMRCVT